MNNYEKIKNMTIEEMAEFILDNTNNCGCCILEEDGTCWENASGCLYGIKQWLLAESEGE